MNKNRAIMALKAKLRELERAQSHSIFHFGRKMMRDRLMVSVLVPRGSVSSVRILARHLITMMAAMCSIIYT